MEKRNYDRKVFQLLKRPDSELITDELEILKEIELYYSNLHSSVKDKGNDLLEEIIGNLEIPKLEDTVRGKPGHSLYFQTRKPPGDDEFTREFYNWSIDLLGRGLVDSFNSAYNTGEMSILQRRGVITLLPKEDSDLNYLITGAQ